MKLYTNGCSFTAGYSDIYEPWPSFLKPHFESVVNLVSHIDHERVIDSIDCHLGGPDNRPEIYDPCFHPNETGNKIIAEHVKTEIEKRNWL